MGSLSAAIEDEFRHDLRFAEVAAESGVVFSHSAFRHDLRFLAVVLPPIRTGASGSIAVSPFIRIPCSLRHRQGQNQSFPIASTVIPLPAIPQQAGPIRTVKDYLRSVGQGSTGVAGLDPR